MAKTFKPLTFGLIEEGRLAKSLDEEIARASHALLAHVKKYGPETTQKSKAEVTLKIAFSPQSAKDGTYSICAGLSSKLPGRPVQETLAIHEAEQTGEETLFVRAAGSGVDEPRQMKLATEDGRGIDLKTGEIMPLPPKKEG